MPANESRNCGCSLGVEIFPKCAPSFRPDGGKLDSCYCPRVHVPSYSVLTTLRITLDVLPAALGIFYPRVLQAQVYSGLRLPASSPCGASHPVSLDPSGLRYYKGYRRRSRCASAGDHDCGAVILPSKHASHNHPLHQQTRVWDQTLTRTSRLFRLLNTLGNAIIWSEYDLDHSYRPVHPWWRRNLLDPLVTTIVLWTFPAAVKRYYHRTWRRSGR